MASYHQWEDTKRLDLMSWSREDDAAAAYGMSMDVLIGKVTFLEQQ